MASITFAIDEKLKADLDHFSWVNWSEITRAEILRDLERVANLEKFLKIVSKSRLNLKDAELLSDKIKTSMHQRLKEQGLI